MIITVQCPSCETSFPVDPDKVPEGGVNARCSVCADVFPVDKPPAAHDVESAAPAEEAPPRAHEVPVEAEPEPEPVVTGWEGEPVEDAAVTDWEIEPEPEPGASTGEPDTMEAEELPDWGVEPEPAAGEESEDVVTSTWDGPEPEGAAVETEPVETEPVETEPVEAEPVEADGPGPETMEAEVEEEPGPGEPPSPEVEGPLEVEAPSGAAGAPGMGVPAGAEMEVVEPELDRPVEPDAGAVPETVPAPSEPPAGFQFGKRDPHEKAQRLARVLVSDMIMYNPERHGRALDGGTLKEDFEDEIQKSWDEYVEQVGEELAGSTSYFSDALNDILARGERVFQGNPPR